MEDDDNDEKIKEILDLVKEIKKNNDELEKNNLDSEIINKTNENSEGEKKNYMKLKYIELYIVDKEPIDKLMEELKYNELENLIKEEDDDDLKDKLEELHKNTDFSDLKEDIVEDINVYNTEKEIDDIIKNEKEVILINENILRSLGVPYKKYKDKKVCVAFKKNINIIYFPEQNFSLLINSSLKSDSKILENKSEKETNVVNNIQTNNVNNNMDINSKQNKINNNIPNISNNNFQNNQINIIQNNNNINENMNKINNPINNQFNNFNNNNFTNNNFNINNNSNQFITTNLINQSNPQNNNQIHTNIININLSEQTINLMNNAQNNKLKLDKNKSIVSNHISFLNYINNLPYLNIPNLNDISQIQNINYNNKINVILIIPEIFEKIKQNIFYDECLIYLNLDINNKQQKYNEILQKINENNNQIDISQIQLIKSYDEFNLVNNEQFMFVNEDFCANIGIDKQYFINSNLFLFKANNEMFLFFADKQKLMKVYGMNQYYKIGKCLGDIIDTPQEIVYNLIDLYKESKKFNEFLTEYELKDSQFKNYYMVNKNWIDQFKQFYNFEDIYIKYEEEYNFEEDDININNNINENNNNDNLIGLSKSQKKRMRRKKRNQNKKNNNNINQSKINNPVIISQHKNAELPKFLLNENNILPIIKTFKEAYYPFEFELIENQTLKKLCNNLYLDVSPNIYEQISIEALPGSNIIILKRKDNSLVIFTVKGITNILEYIIMFEDKKTMNNEINNIKNKGIDQYLIEKYLNFNDDSIQYIPDSQNTSIVGKIYICNKKEIDYNINNNNIYMHNSDNLNTIIGNHQYYQFFNYQILPCRAGLNNIGATCYMNATLQSFCNIPRLQNFFLYNNDLYQNPNAILSRAFGDVMRNLYDRNKNKNSYSPNHFKDVISEMNPLFRGIAANDSKDLILFLLEKMHEELNAPQNYIPEPNISNDLLLFRQSYYSVNRSIITETFIHEMESKIKCCNCGFETYNYNAQNFIIFPLEKTRQYKSLKLSQECSYVTLDECFEVQQTVEYLQGESMIYCNGCRQIRVAEHYNTLNTCPETLIIVLNRGRGNIFKVGCDFPLRMDLYNYIIMKNRCTQYELISVIVHAGGSDMSGHFYAYCKSNIDKKWYRYNDSLVDMLDDNYQYTIKNVGLPYVLFYQNIGCMNNQGNMNNIQNGQVTLYFKLVDINIELYLDVYNYDIFSFVVQKLAQKYNNINYNFFNCYYYILIMNQTYIIDFNKTVLQNNLSDSSFIIIKSNQ